MAIALFGDRSELLFSAAGEQARREAQPGGEVAAGLEALDVVDGRPNSGGDQRPDARDAGQAPSGLIGLDARLDFLAKALDAVGEQVDLLRC